MAKDKITDYDATAANNLDVGGISVAEGMLPSGVNNAIRELMSHQKEAFGSGTPLYVDQVNNRVGINQATPAHPVHVGTDDLIVDTSGNLLVGKTSASTSVVGAAIYSYGTVGATRDGSHAIDLGRNTSDGNIALFRKDGTTVGSIGVASGNAYIDGGAGISGIQFGVGDIRPRYNGALVDGSAADIGHPSNRWQNLYLSGGVYLGGTGSANYLDDYEEGTWTPAFCDASSGGNEFGYTGAVEGRYTKVGSMVTVWFYGRTDGSTTGITTSNQLFIQGLPFTVNMASNGTFAFVRSSTQGTLQATTGAIIARLDNGATYLTMEKQFGDTSAPYSTSALLISEWEGGYGANITGLISYKTDS